MRNLYLRASRNLYQVNSVAGLGQMESAPASMGMVTALFDHAMLHARNRGVRAACGAAAQQCGRVVNVGGERRGRVVFISRRFQRGGIPVHEHTLIRQAEDHALVTEAAVLAVHGAAVLVAKIAWRITYGRQIVRDAIRAGDSDIALALSEGAGNHRAGVVLALRVDIAAGLGGVGCGARCR